MTYRISNKCIYTCRTAPFNAQAYGYLIQHMKAMESETFSYFLPFFSTFFLFTARDHSRDTNKSVNPLNPELNPICYLLALLGAHHFLHVSRISVKLLTFRRLMSYIYIYIYIYIYMEHPFLMVLDHTQRRSTVGRTPLDE